MSSTLPRARALPFFPAAAVVLAALLAVDARLPAQQSDFEAFVEQRVAGQMAEAGIPGLSLAVMRSDRVVLSRGFGFGDVENDVPATAATVYRLASISKPVAAVAVLQLRDRGLLDLDADVRSIVPEFPTKQWTVTPRQLLGHLAGVRHYKTGEGESTEHFTRAAQGLARFADDPLLHEPGTKYQYSTYGFNLLGIAVEKASGVTFATYLREHVAAVAGAESLRDDDVRAVIRHRAQGYAKVAGELRNSQLMDPSYKQAGGGLCSNAPDLARFGAALMAGRLLKAESVKELWTEGRTADGKGTGYGLGFGVAVHDGRRVVSHSGAQARVSTVLYLLPDQGIAVALLCNLEGVRLGGLARQLAARLAGE